MPGEAARLGAVIAYGAGVSGIVASIAGLIWGAAFPGWTADRANLAIYTPNNETINIAFLLAAGIFEGFFLLTFVSVYQALSERSLLSMCFLIGGVTFAGEALFINFAWHLGGELTLVHMYQNAPVGEHASLVTLMRVGLAVHDTADLVAFSFLSLAWLSAGRLMSRQPEFAKLPSWLSYIGALLSGLSIVISLIFGYLTVVSLSFISVLGVVLVIWCFAIGRRLAIAVGKTFAPSPLTN